MNDNDKENMAEFVQLFDEPDRLAAAVVYEEKPTLLIRMQPECYATFQTFKEAGADFTVMTDEFGEDLMLESGIDLDHAIEFCDYFGFEYVIQL